MRAPDSGSRAIPCPPPTTQDQSSITLTWCPRRPSSARVASAMRDSASSSRSRYTRIRGASMASCRFRPNSRKLSSICGCVWRMPYEPGVPMESAKAPSRKTWVGDIMVPDLRPGFSTLGDREARAEGHPERLGDRDHGTLRVGAREVRRLLVDELRRVPFADLAGQPLAA